MSPQRIQRQRTKGWRIPEGAKVVTRPGRFGNPYRAFKCYRVECGPTDGWCVSASTFGPHTRMLNHEDALRSVIALFAEAWAHLDLQAEIQGALRGYDLACWCPLDQPCHADVLLEIANVGLSTVIDAELPGADAVIPTIHSAVSRTLESAHATNGPS